MIPFFEIFSSFFMNRIALKMKKNAKTVVFMSIFAFVGCSFQQSAPEKMVTAITEKSAIEQAELVEFINLSSINGGEKPSIANLICAEYPQVKKLSLRGHDLVETDFVILKHIGKTLFYVDLADCGLEVFPAELFDVAGLTTLYLSDNSLREIDPAVYSLDKLTYLNLDRNSITNIPEGVSRLKSLKWLRLNDNNLTGLPKDMGELKNIKRLYLSKNELTEVPEVIKQMTSLEELNLGGNKITEFPEWLCEMPNLQRIDLYGNPIKTIPEKVIDMPNLKTLVMDNCLLENDKKLELNKKLADKRIKFIF